MCGIAGIVAENARGYMGHLDRMVKALAHRGPDGSGTHFYEKCALGHTRLSIVDLATGAQPMLSPVYGEGITFNGEIYGYRDIRKLLDDFPFRTKSDTEVILALYHRYGNRCISHLPGMFAFGIWDERENKLFCARDRFGEKPFYYAAGRNGEFIFASEIKAILASGLVTPALSRKAVGHYLQYLYVHPRETIYENIFTLPPAHCLTYNKGRVSVEQYWRLPETTSSISLTDATGRFSELFGKAVTRQLVADVPVGAFLSGGLDSSTVVAVASGIQGRLKTFSFEFEDQASELPYAREVAGLYQTDHAELTDRTADIGEMLIRMQQVYDEPFADSSNIPMYLISKLAREHVKVVLTGDGGDELLAGYSYWYPQLLSMEEGESKELIVRTALRLSRALGITLAPSFMIKAIAADFRHRYCSVVTAHAGQKKCFSDHDLVGLGFEMDCSDEKGYKGSTLDDALRMDIETYMPGDILVKTDRASMAHGLELRTPFLDVDFASFCISLPYSLKLTAEEDKLIMRRTFSDKWPESIRQRGKQGFGAPVSRWLKLASVRALVDRYLNDSGQKIFSILDFKHAREAVRQNNQKTWILLVLALWMAGHEFSLAGEGRE